MIHECNYFQILFFFDVKSAFNITRVYNECDDGDDGDDDDGGGTTAGL